MTCKVLLGYWMISHGTRTPCLTYLGRLLFSHTPYLWEGINSSRKGSSSLPPTCTKAKYGKILSTALLPVFNPRSAVQRPRVPRVAAGGGQAVAQRVPILEDKSAGETWGAWNLDLSIYLFSGV